MLWLLALSFFVTSITDVNDATELERHKLASAKDAYLKAAQHAKTEFEKAANELILRKSRAKSEKDRQIYDELEREMQLFQKSGLLPWSPLLKVEVKAYKSAVQKAKKECEKAFDTFHKYFVALKDNENAKATLDDKQEFFEVLIVQFQPGTFAVETDPKTGPSIIEMRIDGTYTQTHDRVNYAGKWEQNGGQLELSFSNGKFGRVDLEIKDQNHAIGANTHDNGNQWGWQIKRWNLEP